MGEEGILSSYEDFLAQKVIAPNTVGLVDISNLAAHLFDFQKECTEFALRAGRAGMFLSTGLGKTLVELEFARIAGEATNGCALILCPLAVAWQFAKEGDRFGYNARVIRDQSEVRDGINICNYDRLDHIDCDAFDVVVLDESSILKAFGGKTATALINAFSHCRFRLAATATPAPNDHMEFGNHSAFLSQMSSMEMLSKFFINDTSKASQSWRLKGHAINAFWDWVATWARCASKPSDLSSKFDDSAFELPTLKIHHHKVSSGSVKAADGELFSACVSATTMFDLKRQTARDRAVKIASLVNDNPDPWVIWCDTNIEADHLCNEIECAIEVRGSDPTEKKEDRLRAFADGHARVLVTKPSICGYGLNWQHCANMAFVGRTFSYESYFQAVRRCWRFGQKRPVNVHIAVGEGEDLIAAAVDRKAEDHQEMQRAMAAAMRRSSATGRVAKIPYNPTFKGKLPAWLRSEKSASGIDAPFQMPPIKMLA